MNSDQDESNIALFLYIIEEYVLLNFMSLNTFPNLMQIIHSKYEFANSLDNNEEALEVKIACLNLATTIYQIIYESKNLEHLKIFEVKLKIIK